MPAKIVDVATAQIGLHYPPMNDDELEARVLKRDKRFVVRVVLALGAVLVVGIWAANALTSPGTSGCVANVFERVVR